MTVVQAPQEPIKNFGLLYMNGLQISNDATTPLTVIDVAVGQCRDSTNTNDIVVNAVYNVTTVPPTLITNYVTISSAVSGAGGLDVGTIAASTMYAVYAIGSSAYPAYQVNYAPINQVPPVELPFSYFPGTAIISTNFTAPVLPNNYDMFRRIGTVVTDGASHFVPFTQVALNGSDRYVTYGSPVNVVTAGHATGYTASNLNVTSPAVPVSGAVNVQLSVSFTPTTAGDSVSFQPTGAGAGTVYASVSGSVAGVATLGVVTCPDAIVTGLAEISYKVTAAGDSVTWGVLGFTDLL